MISRWFFPMAALAVGFAGARLSPKGAIDPQPFAAPVGVSVPQAPSAVPVKMESTSRAAPLSGGHAYDAGEVQRLLAAPSEIRRLGGLRIYFRSMAPSEFQRAYDDLSSRGEKSQPALSSMCKCWAAIAPAQALRQAQRAEGDFRKQLIAVVMNGWAERDAAQARDGAKGLTAVDQEVALNAIKAVEGYLAKSKASEVPVAQRPAPSHREIFWANVKLMNGSHSWNETATKAFAKWAREDPEGATQEMANSVLATSESFLMELYEAWKEKDPAKAAEFLQGLNEYKRNKVMGERVGKLAKENVAAARAMADAAPNLEQRTKLIYRIAQTVWEKQPALTIEILQGTSEAMRTAQYPDFLVGMWLQREPEKAAAWVLQDPVFWKAYDAGTLGRLISSDYVLQPWIAKDPRGAANFVIKMHSKEHPDLLAWVGKPWIAKDPQAAVDWARSLPSDPVQAEALKQFVYLWAGQDAQTATAFFHSLPKGAGKTGAAEGYAFQVFGNDPDAALKAIHAIADEAKKLDVLERAWKNWHRKNPQAADDWREKNRNLTLEEREILVER